MTGAGGDWDPELIGRCYTKARRSPLVYGVIRDVRGGRGLRLAGGPYTMTQLTAIIVTVGLLVMTRPLWGGHGVGDIVVLLALPFGAAFALRRLQVDGRNPAAAAASVIAMLAAPRRGVLGGRAYRPASARRTSCLLTLPGCAGSGAEAPVPLIGRLPATAAAAPADAASTAPTGPPVGAVASGVQALLARRTAHPSSLVES
ncbi:hypothetical protein J7F03_02780 [Streptomyces sp. ISL-43]|uniref:hypothetical protein n=1 Tax=Streptomyces sp. ISL-43 TaxID=2819183 RepID=UPI001BEB2409|nr:hypothetical protein [Streptomyces sp. ISL-43]MBT2446029.1 hypothetical protein [Streptomyces sp. ISL-43]